MSEGVELLIRADDQASRVLDNVAENVDQKIKRIKDVGGKAKASTEFIGTLANTMGGTAIGGYAGQLAQLTERVSAFSEVSKAGTAGALAFKAGLLGIAAVGGFKVGIEIGKLVADTAKWIRMLDASSASLNKAAETAKRLGSVKLDIEFQKIELIEDPAAQEAALRQMFNDLQATAAQHEKNIKLLKEAAAEEDKTMAGRARNLVHGEEIARAREAELAADLAALANIEAQQLAIEKKISADAIELDLLKQKNALQAKNKETIAGLEKEVELLAAAKDQRTAIEALQKAGGDVAAAKRIEELMIEKDRLTEKAAAEKLLVDEQLKDAKRIEDLRVSETLRLKEQRIELEQGAEAARRFALEQKGLDSATAARLASEEAAIAELRAEQEQKAEAELSPQQSVQGRLLTRGPGDDIGKKQLATQEKMVKELTQIKEKLPLSLGSVQFEVVGRG
jgi:hypothetical protein